MLVFLDLEQYLAKGSKMDLSTQLPMHPGVYSHMNVTMLLQS